MKNKFNFLQFTNWLIICRDNIIQIREQVLKEEISKEEALEKLKGEKRKIGILRGVLDRNVRLHGVQKDFLKKLKDLKKEYGIED